MSWIYPVLSTAPALGQATSALTWSPGSFLPSLVSSLHRSQSILLHSNQVILLLGQIPPMASHFPRNRIQCLHWGCPGPMWSGLYNFLLLPPTTLFLTHTAWATRNSWLFPKESSVLLSHLGSRWSNRSMAYKPGVWYWAVSSLGLASPPRASQRQVLGSRMGSQQVLRVLPSEKQWT